MSTTPEPRLAHYVATEPFEPLATEALTPEQERFYRASQWRIMWWKFKRHRIAVFCALILLAVYASILVSEVLAPYNLHSRDSRHIYAPPQDLHLFHEGKFIGPFVYGYAMELNMQNMRGPQPRSGEAQPLRFSARARVRVRAFRRQLPSGLSCRGRHFSFSHHRLGRDVFSRITATHLAHRRLPARW
jgi:peptide/nickel transport system permease protein